MPPRSGPPAYTATGFLRFLDRLMHHGLEAFRLYYGVYRGVVVSNTDDNNQGRINVRVPAVGDTQDVSRLAYPKVPGGAGDGYGFRAPPPVGSIVWITFENGKLDMPVWEAGAWGKDQIPSDLRDPDTWGWWTPHGHKVTLDGRDNQKKIRIEHSNGAYVEMDNDGNVRVFNVSGKTVYVGLDANEAAVLGDTLKGLLDELIDAIAALTVPTGMGPSGTPVNVAQFQGIKARWRNFLSQTVKVK